MDDAGYLLAGYGLFALTVGGYVGWLFARARRARARAEAVADRRR